MSSISAKTSFYGIRPGLRMARHRAVDPIFGSISGIAQFGDYDQRNERNPSVSPRRRDPNGLSRRRARVFRWRFSTVQDGFGSNSNARGSSDPAGYGSRRKSDLAAKTKISQPLSTSRDNLSSAFSFVGRLGKGRSRRLRDLDWETSFDHCRRPLAAMRA